MAVKGGLEKQIRQAFIDSSGAKDDLGNIPRLARDITDAIIDFLTKQTFTITELKASLEIEEISTVAPLFADVLPSVTVATPSGPGTIAQGKSGVLIPKLKMKKSGGQGGVLISTGHSYIGRPARKIRGSDTVEEFNDFTKVRLDPDKIVGR